MSQNNVIPTQKINDAAAGDKEAMREILRALANTTNLQTTAGNTGTKNVPQQGKALVSFLQNNYVVQIFNPGATTPTSAIQAAQATQGATSSTNIAPVTAIYYQIRVATSPRFSISDNVQTFGGDTGSTQTYWTLTGLGSGRFYFQFRSSYDGVNWNLWRNANGGQTITHGIEGVTQEAVDNATWAAFTLSGDQLVAFGEGFTINGGTFDVATGLYTSAMLAIPGPNGFTQTGNLSHGIKDNTITQVIPNPPPALSAPADYPNLVTEDYRDGPGNVWSGSANIFGFAFDPLGTNQTTYTTAAGRWVVFTLPGGAQMAVAMGTQNNGTPIDIPAALTWFSATEILGVVTPQGAFASTNEAHGVNEADFRISGGTVIPWATFEDGSGNIWGDTVNWFLVAFSSGVVLTALTGGKWAQFTLPDGTKVAIGSGQIASGSAFALPAGFTASKMVSFASPATFNDTGHAMSGVSSCYISGTTPFLAYQDGANNFWDGDCAWISFCWQ